MPPASARIGGFVVFATLAPVLEIHSSRQPSEHLRVRSIASMAAQTRPRKVSAPKSARPVPRSGRKLTVADITKDLGISTRTFYRWKKAGAAPETFPLPGGGLRVHESVYTAWLEERSLESAR
jgi:predicted DNA-binding transcriptional regulator AlpA